MTKIKTFLLRAFDRFRGLRGYQQALLILAFIVLAVFLYIFFSLAFISRDEIRLAELERSYKRDKFCREECLKERRVLASHLIRAWREQAGSRLVNRFKDKMLSVESERNFKLAMVEILGEAAYTAPPEFLFTYLNREDADPYVSAGIYTNFSPDSWEADGLGGGAGDMLSVYFEIIASDAALPLKAEAIRQIGRFGQQPGAYNIRQVADIAHWLQSDSINNKLKYGLVMLLGGYYPSFPEESEEALKTTYWSAASSALVKALAGDLLNRFEPDGGPEGAGWEIPAVGEEEWDDYYSD